MVSGGVLGVSVGFVLLGWRDIVLLVLGLVLVLVGVRFEVV